MDEREPAVGAFDRKYGYVTTERGEFHYLEPVFVLRASDSTAIAAIARYRDAAIALNLPAEFIAGLEVVISDFAEFAVANPKVADLPD